MICLSRKLRLLFSLICISHMQEAKPAGLKTSLGFPTNVWIPYISLRTWLTKLYSTTLRSIYMFLYTEQAYGGNIFSPHTFPSHQLTKEHHQPQLVPEWVLWPLWSCSCLCWAECFLRKAAECRVLGLQEARRISEEEARAENRSEEREEPQGSTRDFFGVGASQKSPSSHILPGFYRWQASQCNGVDGRLAHLAFRNQSVMLLNSY